MKRLFLSTLIAAGLSFVGVNSFAYEMEQQTNPQMYQGTPEQGEMTFKMSDQVRMMGLSGVIGKVVSVEGDHITVRDNAGITRSFLITGSQRLEELQSEAIKVGDIVRVQFAEQGTKVLISKMGES
jgi:hypothetical protein